MEAKDALKLYEQAKSYWSENYADAASDLRFSVGLDHWSDSDLIKRRKRQSFVVNELPQFIHQVANDMRQNTPSINVLPTGSGASIETAKIFKGLIRNIEYRSKADEVYDTAGENAVRCGFGFIRVDHDYVSDEGFEQELLIKRVHNPLSVWLDPSSVEADGSDANWGIITETITKTEFEKAYPGREFISFELAESKDQPIADKVITIAEVFIKEFKESKKIVDKNGNDAQEETEETKSRKSRKVTIRRYKFNGEEEALEKTTFPGKYVPIVPEYGEEVWVDGKRMILSLIRQSKDAQRALNMWCSAEAEILIKAPQAPFMAAYGQTNDFKEWEDPENATVLQYKPTDEANNPLPAPQRLSPPTIPTGIVNAIEGAKQRIKETLGLYNTSIGERSNEVSGKAINARKEEGDNATFHFLDNRVRAIQQVGRICVCAIPEIYDTPRIIRIMNDEDTPLMVGVNGAPTQEGQDIAHDLKVGEYDVRVTTGASYTTKRQETAALLSDLIKANPQLMGVVGDLLFKNMDVAGNEAIAERIKKTIPPALTQGEDGKEEAPDPQKQQMAQLIQQLQTQVQQMDSELQSKQAEQQTKQAELNIKAQEVGIKQQEVGIKQGELKLKYLQAASEPTPQPSSSPTESTSIDDPIEVLHARMQKKLSDKQSADTIAQQQQEQAAQQAAIEAQIAAEDKQREHLEMQLKIQQTDAVINALGSISQQLNQLTVQVSQPIDVIRDANGVIVGAK